MSNHPEPFKINDALPGVRTSSNGLHTQSANYHNFRWSLSAVFFSLVFLHSSSSHDESASHNNKRMRICKSIIKQTEYNIKKQSLTYFQEIVAGTHCDRDDSTATGTAGNCREECSSRDGASDDADADGPVRILGRGPALRPLGTGPPGGAGCAG